MSHCIGRSRIGRAAVAAKPTLPDRLYGNLRHRAEILSSNSPDPLRGRASGGILARGLGIAGPGDCCRGSVGKVPGAVRFGPLSMGTPSADCQAIRQERVPGEGKETPGRACARELSLAPIGGTVKQARPALCLTASQCGTGVWLLCTSPGPQKFNMYVLGLRRLRGLC